MERVCASRKLGTAMAARMAMIATTIRSSINVKPLADEGEAVDGVMDGVCMAVGVRDADARWDEGGAWDAGC